MTPRTSSPLLALAAALLTIAAPARSQIIANGSFESPAISANTFTYFSLLEDGAAGWSYSGDAGLIHGPSGFSAPPAPAGSQIGFLQLTDVAGDFSSIYQTITLPATGLYTLTFQDAGRNFGFQQTAPYDVWLDGGVIYSDSVSNGQPFTLETVNFAATAGPHVLTFRLAQDLGEFAVAIYLDDVKVIPEPSGSVLLATGIAALGIRRRQAPRQGSGEIPYAAISGAHLL